MCWDTPTGWCWGQQYYRTYLPGPNKMYIYFGMPLTKPSCNIRTSNTSWEAASDRRSSKMAVGDCFCGRVRVEFSGQPIKSVSIPPPGRRLFTALILFLSQQGLCHCSDCRKLTGAPYSYSFVVKTADLEVTGSPKAVAKTADSGNHIKNYFCPDCGL